ncbi:regulatory protein Crp [Halogeometricum pallidum JCM 14848]|uniref:Regulatory protein Crp n=1 Tax=Halogeometricum pallidum JCM 14848 TaxID=1227487 RepID=M0DEN7_HALPD|nr:winged helix-turn-helix transcriptional regulator [Halogeometricum pallidum]ELZ33925.1 regulatory protein Crp [Halogeometricum pallidum JCM 14848]
MAKDADEADEFGVLRSKRNATRYQILVQIAERQPAVNQQEIADAIGVTSQAVSDYLRDLSEEGYVNKHGRGRYEVTKEGVDWLISQTDELRTFVRHVSEDVIGQVEIETAIATTDIAEGETVSLSMQNGVLRAVSGGTGSATAVAVTGASAGADVGITNFDGVVDYELGTVTILSVPQVQKGGSSVVVREQLADMATSHDLVAVAGAEGLAAVNAANLDPDIRFGSASAVHEAATKGLDVLLVAATDVLSPHTDKLREGNISYEVVDTAEE